MEILFAQLIVIPAATEQRQIDVALYLIVERQTRYQQLPSFNVFLYDAAGVRTHDLPVMRRTLYWLSQAGQTVSHIYLKIIPVWERPISSMWGDRGRRYCWRWCAPLLSWRTFSHPCMLLSWTDRLGFLRSGQRPGSERHSLPAATPYRIRQIIQL